MLATAWKDASGKDASGNMTADNNDYRIGAWYAALTGLDASQTYYLVREYLDKDNDVLAVDWGKYSGVDEKFVYSSWGMNLQDKSYHQRELKDTIKEISKDVAKVRFTLTTAKPVGKAGKGQKSDKRRLVQPRLRMVRSLRRKLAPGKYRLPISMMARLLTPKSDKRRSKLPT